MKQDCSNLNELNNYCHTYNIHKNKCCQLKFSLYFLLKCIEKFISINNEIYTVKNDTASDFTKTFTYDASLKTIEEFVDPSIVPQPTPVIGSYIADFSASVAQQPDDKQFLQNFAGTAYVKNGDDIFEITNNGSAQDIVFDIDAQTGMLVPVNAPGVSVNKMSTAVFSSLNGNNFSSVINPGETQYMMFTINGVQRVYKVTNNSADKQSVIYEKTGEIMQKGRKNSGKTVDYFRKTAIMLV